MNTAGKISFFLGAIVVGAVCARVIFPTRGGMGGSGHSGNTGEVVREAAWQEGRARAVSIIRRHRSAMEMGLKKVELAKVSDLAFGTVRAAKDVEEAGGKAIVDAAEAVRAMADLGNVNEARARMGALAQAVEDLDAKWPALWACEMRCEGEKVYGGARICPICRMALNRADDLPFGVAATTDPVAPRAGEPTNVRLKLLDQIGLPVKSLEVVHDRVLHLLVVSDDLSWFAHEHPKAVESKVANSAREFEITMTFPIAGGVTMFTDFTPTGYGQQVPSKRIVVSGTPTSAAALTDDTESVHMVDGYEARLRCNGKLFYAGEDSILRFALSRDGKPVEDLEPYLGAKGHLVIVSKDRSSFVHGHPVDGHPSNAGGGDEGGHAQHLHAAHVKDQADGLGNGSPTDVSFHVVFPKPGIFRAWGQFQHKGRVLTVPFTIDVQPGSGQSVPGMQQPEPHDHGSMSKE